MISRAHCTQYEMVMGWAGWTGLSAKVIALVWCWWPGCWCLSELVPVEIPCLYGTTFLYS